MKTSFAADFLNQHLQFSVNSQELTSASASSHIQLLTASSLSTFISMETEQGKFVESLLVFFFFLHSYTHATAQLARMGISPQHPGIQGSSFVLLADEE